MNRNEAQHAAIDGAKITRKKVVGCCRSFNYIHRGRRTMKILLIILFIFGCTTNNTRPIIKPKEKPEKPQDLTRRVNLWATWYFVPSLTSIPNGIHVRNMKNKTLGPKLSRKDWCQLAMEGTGFIDGKTYNYAGTTWRYKVKCQHGPSGRVKFYETKEKYGIGNRNNPLRPFVSIACDQKKFKYGQKFFIPKAKGVLLPNNKIHNGIFVCEDVGGLIKGNHIDVFIGAEKKNFFDFVKSNKSKTFEAYLQ